MRVIIEEISHRKTLSDRYMIKGKHYTMPVIKIVTECKVQNKEHIQ